MKGHICLALFLALIGACNATPNSSNSGTAQVAENDQSAQKKTTSTGKVPVQEFDAEGDFAGSHILIAYAGAARAKPEISRTKEEALEKARQLLAVLVNDPLQWDEMAKHESDGPSAHKSGDLGSWKKGRMVPEFEKAIATIELGTILPVPVETSFGYHIIRRNRIPREPHLNARMMMITYQGAKGMHHLKVTRTKEEAAALAKKVAEELTPANFEELGKKYNDAGEGAFTWGPVTPSTNSFPNLFEALGRLHYDAIAGPVEIPSGFVFVKRMKIEKRTGSHILIGFLGSKKPVRGATLNREEAQALAKDVLTKIKQDPSQFESLARQHSHCPSAPNGGHLGTWTKGAMVASFETAYDALKPNEVTPELVETVFGFHIIKRGTLEN